VARYYHAVVEPSGDVPFISYYVSAAEKQARGIAWMGRHLKRDKSAHEFRHLLGHDYSQCQVGEQEVVVGHAGTTDDDSGDARRKLAGLSREF
jgi:hypothetical protein